eukprot:scaffold834_cov311-Prasinococcus_capsulatus_cf.AAC.1
MPCAVGVGVGAGATGGGGEELGVVGAPGHLVDAVAVLAEGAHRHRRVHVPQLHRVVLQRRPPSSHPHRHHRVASHRVASRRVASRRGGSVRVRVRVRAPRRRRRRGCVAGRSSARRTPRACAPRSCAAGWPPPARSRPTASRSRRLRIAPRSSDQAGASPPPSPSPSMRRTGGGEQHVLVLLAPAAVVQAVRRVEARHLLRAGAWRARGRQPAGQAGRQAASPTISPASSRRGAVHATGRGAAGIGAPGCSCSTWRRPLPMMPKFCAVATASRPSSKGLHATAYPLKRVRKAAILDCRAGTTSPASRPAGRAHGRAATNEGGRDDAAPVLLTPLPHARARRCARRAARPPPLL